MKMQHKDQGKSGPNAAGHEKAASDRKIVVQLELDNEELRFFAAQGGDPISFMEDVLTAHVKAHQNR